MSLDKNLISVGEIINTQGIKGELRVWPLTDFPERFEKDGVFVCEKNGVTSTLTVEQARPHKKFFVIKFKEIIDMNTAEQFVGGVLKVSEGDLVKLPEDTFYIFEITGMEVITDEGLVLGKIKEVLQTGSNDIYVVAGKTKEYLIPAIKEIVKQVDKDNGQIHIKPLEGLLDI